MLLKFHYILNDQMHNHPLDHEIKHKIPLLHHLQQLLQPLSIKKNEQTTDRKIFYKISRKSKKERTNEPFDNSI